MGLWGVGPAGPAETAAHLLWYLCAALAVCVGLGLLSLLALVVLRFARRAARPGAPEDRPPTPPSPDP